MTKKKVRLFFLLRKYPLGRFTYLNRNDVKILKKLCKLLQKNREVKNNVYTSELKEF